MALAALAPGIAPYAGARVGVGDHWRPAWRTRAAGRASISERAWRKARGRSPPARRSNAVFAGGTTSTTLNGVDIVVAPRVRLRRAAPRRVAQHGGALPDVGSARAAGGERYYISTLSTEPALASPRPTGLEADRAHVGGVLGVATGFRHVHVALELEAGFEYLTARGTRRPRRCSGAALTPATALWWDF